MCKASFTNNSCPLPWSSTVVSSQWIGWWCSHWEETTVLDHGRGQELLVKEALHIQMTPVEERFNRDGGLEVHGYK